MTRKKENPGLGPGWPDFSTIIGHLHKALPVSG
jgi:hypothetical protein